MRTRLLEHARALWRAAKDEHTAPGKLAAAVAMGVFVGCTPALMFHGPIAVALATIFRLSRLWAFLGSRVSNFLVLPWIVLGEIQIAHRLRTGQWVAIFVADAKKRAPEMLLDWCVGTVPVGLTLAAMLGAMAYALARARDRKRSPEGACADARLSR